MTKQELKSKLYETLCSHADGEYNITQEEYKGLIADILDLIQDGEQLNVDLTKEQIVYEIAAYYGDDVEFILDIINTSSTMWKTDRKIILELYDNLELQCEARDIYNKITKIRDKYKDM